jgi:hypothetical protein
LREALVMQQKADDTRWVAKAFDESWRSADATLTVEGP